MFVFDFNKDVGLDISMTDKEKIARDIEDRMNKALAKGKSAAEKLGAAIRARREMRKMSQNDLAALAGTSQQTIDRLEKGQTRHSRAFPRVLAALGIADARALSDLVLSEASVDNLVTELRAEYSQADSMLREFPRVADAERLPVYTLDADSSGYFMDVDPADFIYRPEPLIRVRRGYGLIVPDDTNAPIFRAGDTVFMNPHLPIRKDNEVVFSRTSGKLYCLLATLVEEEKDVFVVRHALGKPYRIKSSEWIRQNVIVGKFSRT